MNLHRTKDNKWIFQKNVQSKDLIESFLKVIENKDTIDYGYLKEQLTLTSGYIGRSNDGSLNTMGVRLSQMCFYMFGYKIKNKFILSPMTQKLLNSKKDLNKKMLINLFSLQYPHPFSKTSSNFNIYVGRLITKLLLDERIQKRLYIDEFIWFLPFIERIDENIYTNLINEIIDFRNLSYNQKKNLFESIQNFNDVFSNVLHEVNYYFIRIFESFNVFEVVPDANHNDGKLFRFLHGISTYRNDSYKSKAKISGFIKFNDDIENDAFKLISLFDCTEKPITQNTYGIFSSEDWIRTLYEFEPLQYLSVVDTDFEIDKDITKKLRDMTHKSIYGSKDGKEFEVSLKNTMEIFEDILNVELISGSGETDILCIFRDDLNIFKINLDAKTSSKRVASLNSKRLENHLRKTGAKYCLVVSPKYSKGVKLDIDGSKVSIIEAETLATYISKEHFSSVDNSVKFKYLNTIIERNLGKAIDSEVIAYIENVYGI